jgi:hypothetical protein
VDKICRHSSFRHLAAYICSAGQPASIISESFSTVAQFLAVHVVESFESK